MRYDRDTINATLASIARGNAELHAQEREYIIERLRTQNGEAPPRLWTSDGGLWEIRSVDAFDALARREPHSEARRLR